MVANLTDILTPDIVSTSDFVNTEYLQTLVAIIPKYANSCLACESHSTNLTRTFAGISRTRGCRNITRWATRSLSMARKAREATYAGLPWFLDHRANCWKRVIRASTRSQS